MALKRTDCVMLLTELQENGIDVKDQIKTLYSSESIPQSVLKFINEHKQLDALSFYEEIRKKYNNKKSDLYINIVKEIEDPQEVLTTLSALQLQIILYSKKVEDKNMFYDVMRADEISRVLTNYFTTYSIEYPKRLLQLYKADLKFLETIRG